ncbi:MAG: RidA family protein [Alphaproteobacteria bacterium]|nr:RidA family protein [Alphaproteobacteria bacterium]
MIWPPPGPIAGFDAGTRPYPAARRAQPARTTVGVTGLALGALVEIDLVVAL